MFGTWFADVVLENATAAPTAGSRLTLAVGTGATALSLVGTVLPGLTGLDFAAQPHVAVAGGVGWDTPLGPRSYQSDAGTRLATVLRDLANVTGEPARTTDTGETLASLPPDVSLGAAPVVRPGSAPGAPVTGGSILLALWKAKALPPWWVRGDGLTVFGARPTGQVTGRVDVMRRDAGVGWKLLGIDGPAGFLPGLAIEGQTIKRLVVRETGSTMVGEVWT
jgi:hypothetical protein